MPVSTHSSLIRHRPPLLLGLAGKHFVFMHWVHKGHLLPRPHCSCRAQARLRGPWAVLLCQIPCQGHCRWMSLGSNPKQQAKNTGWQLRGRENTCQDPRICPVINHISLKAATRAIKNQTKEGLWTHRPHTSRFCKRGPKRKIKFRRLLNPL